jgi:hypothetical protein
MKLQILVLFLIFGSLIDLSIQDSFSNSDSNSSESDEQFDCGLDCFGPFLARLKSLAAVTRSTNFTYYWDFIPLKVRYYLLNQNQLGLKNNIPVGFDFKWSSLSDSVRVKLIEQKTKDLFFGLSLYEWGLTQNPTDRLANLTLSSLIKPSKLATFEALKQTLSPINFDFKLDNNLVNAYVASLNKYGLTKAGNYKKLWTPIDDLLESYVTKASLSSTDKYALNLILYMADLRFKARL